MSRSPFVFVVCQAGAENHLKKEVARLQSDWKPAFSRPGFVTFKAPEPVPLDVPLSAVFARAYAVSFGKTKDLAEVKAFAAKTAHRPHIHVFVREQVLPGDDDPRGLQIPPGIASDADRPLLKGETVVDVCVVEPGEYWFGAHIHSPLHAPWPGGRPTLIMPAAAPSRAYLKMQEALLWSGVELAPGETVLELGSAPGGASLVFLERGVNVVGVDTADMAPLPEDKATLRQVRKKAALLKASDVGPDVTWLALDINLHPNDVFKPLEKVMAFVPKLKGALLTFKLTDARLAAQVPALLERVKALGFKTARARQLAYGRREVFVFAKR